MAEACGFCYRSYLLSRKLNESLKCACQRPFFSQTLARSNIPTDRDCWIEVPKKFVRHYSSLFGETVTFEGDDGRSYSCSLVGSDISIVGYGFEWYNYAGSHDVGIGDQVVVTLIEKSRFFVQVYKAIPQTMKVEVRVEKDFDVQITGAQDWLLAKTRRTGTNISVKVEADVDNLPADMDRPPLQATPGPKINKEIEGNILHMGKTGSVEARAQTEDAKDEGAESDEAKCDLASASCTTSSPRLCVKEKRDSYGAELGTRRTYVSKRRPVSSAERERVFEAAKACPITHNSFGHRLRKKALPSPAIHDSSSDTKSKGPIVHPPTSKHLDEVWKACLHFVNQRWMDECLENTSTETLESLGLSEACAVKYPQHSKDSVHKVVEFVAGFDTDARVLKTEHGAFTITSETIRHAMKLEESQEPHKRKRPVSETDHMFGTGRLTGNGYRIENCIHEDWKPIMRLVNGLFLGSSKPEQLNGGVAYCYRALQGEACIPAWAEVVLDAITREVKLLQTYLGKRAKGVVPPREYAFYASSVVCHLYDYVTHLRKSCS